MCWGVGGGCWWWWCLIHFILTQRWRLKNEVIPDQSAFVLYHRCNGCHVCCTPLLDLILSYAPFSRPPIVSSSSPTGDFVAFGSLSFFSCSTFAQHLNLSPRQSSVFPLLSIDLFHAGAIKQACVRQHLHSGRLQITRGDLQN